MNEWTNKQVNGKNARKTSVQPVHISELNIFCFESLVLRKVNSLRWPCLLYIGLWPEQTVGPFLVYTTRLQKTKGQKQKVKALGTELTRSCSQIGRGIWLTPAENTDPETKQEQAVACSLVHWGTTPAHSAVGFSKDSHFSRCPT